MTTLKKNYQFQKVYRSGSFFANRQLMFYYLPNRLPENRLGISVSKKVGGAVIRKHVTRLIRECFRLLEKDKRLPVGYDLVFVAKPLTKDATYHEVSGAMIHLLKKQRLLND